MNPTRILVTLTCLIVCVTLHAQVSGAFGWGTCSDASGSAYTLDGGQRNSDPQTIVLYASGGDDRQTIIDAVTNYDIVVLDGSKGDFIVSSSMKLYNLTNRTIVGRNHARLCTEWYITSELKAALTAANLSQYSSSSGTGGTLSNGQTVDEARELHTRQTIIDFTGDTNENYRKSGLFIFNGTNENIIIRNIVLVGPGCCDVGGYDLISNNGASHVWIDHCEFLDGMDGNLDSGHHSKEMFVTYSWNIFQYTDRSFSHPYSNGVGWANGYLQYITYAYNIWGPGCQRRLPQAEWVYIHLLNNYYNCSGNSVCIALNANTHGLVEGNYAASGVKNPFVPGSYSDLYYVTRDNYGFGSYNNANNTSQSLEVPYSYTKISTSEVPSVLQDTHGSGATIDDIIEAEGYMDGVDEEAEHQLIYALKEGDTFASGTQIVLDQIIMTYGEKGGYDFTGAKASKLDDNFSAYTPGNGVNGDKAGGTFYVFEPQKSGTITAGVVLNNGKKMYIEENGTALADYNGLVVDTKYSGTYTFNVTAGKVYKLYCAGSKLGYYGFIYKWKESKNTSLIGDANEDGVVDISDVLIMVDYILGKQADINLDNADVVEDDVIDISDVLSVVDIILGK